MPTTSRSWILFAALSTLLASSFFCAVHTAPAGRALAVAAPRVQDEPGQDVKNEAIDPESRRQIRDAASQLPLSFEPNVGQTQSEVKYLSRGNGYTFYVTPTDAVMFLRRGKRASDDVSALRFSLLGGDKNAPMKGMNSLPGTTNYFKGKTELSGVPTFARVRSENVYPGIDLVYYGNNRQLEYDFVVAPHADPSVIKVAIDGAERAILDENGDLLLHLPGGVVRQHAPVIYQNIQGKQTPVNGHFVVSSDDCTGAATTYVSFAIASYDESLPLIIDPVLVFSTIFGDRPNIPQGASEYSGDEAGNGIAIDSFGNIYIVGYTNSVEFPLLSPILTRTDGLANAGGGPHREMAYDAFITKFNPNVTALVYSTYLSNNSSPTDLIDFQNHQNDDIAIAVVVNAQGEPYICGNTFSGDFPVKNAISTYSGAGDIFLTKLSATGTDIVFSTYLGGSGLDAVLGMAIDSSSNIYLAGSTISTVFRTANAIQNVNRGGMDGWVSKIRGDGSVLLYSTFLGGGGDDACTSVASDASGNAYITGFTRSTNFPLAGAYQILKSAGSDAFITKINSTGSLIVYSTYLGGDGDDQGNGIALDSGGNAYIAGFTSSSDFPTVSPTVLPVQSTGAGGRDAFVSKLDPFGSTLIFSTYLGGSGTDEAKTIAVDNRSAVYVAGVTNSPNFPLAPATNTLQTGLAGGRDGFIAKFNPTGVPLVYSTYFGSGSHYVITDRNFYIVPTRPILFNPASPAIGNPVAPPAPANTFIGFDTDDEIRSLVTDNNGNAYVTGLTNGSFVATFGAFSTVTPFVPTAGEDFPAPYVEFTVLTDGTVIKQPAEAIDLTETTHRDLSDAYVSKILDSSPIISSPQTARGTLQSNFTYVITATNNPDRFNAAGLPPGLSISTSDGQIAGVPQITGNFKVVLTASNASGTGAQILFLNISSLPPRITSPLTATGRVGDVFQYTIAATNDPGSFSAPGLPPGLNVDAITGLISGVPIIEGQFSVQITAVNGAGSDVKTLVLSIVAATPVISSSAVAQGVLNQAFTYTITATNNPSSYNASGLPLGLTVNTNSGQITGTPVQLGSFNVTLTATNGGGTGSLPLSLTIIQAAVPIVSSPDAAAGTINEPFSFTITANNSPLVYGVEPTSLPNGLELNDATGVISGVPTALSANLTTFSSSNLLSQSGLVGQNITFNSGPNNGQTRVILSFLAGSGTVVLSAPLPAIPLIGDTFSTTSTIAGNVNSATGTTVAVAGTVISPSGTIDGTTGAISANTGTVTAIQGGFSGSVTSTQGVFNGVITPLNGVVLGVSTAPYVAPTAIQLQSLALNNARAPTGALVGQFVYMLTGPNTGLERMITSFTATVAEGTVGFAAGFPVSVVEGDQFSILPSAFTLNSTNLFGVTGLIDSTLRMTNGTNVGLTRVIDSMFTGPSAGFIGVSVAFPTRLSIGDNYQITPTATIAITSTSLIGRRGLVGLNVTMTNGTAAGETRPITGFDTLTGTIIVGGGGFTTPPAIGNLFNISQSFNSFSASSLTSESGLIGRTVTMTNGPATGQTSTIDTFDSPTGTITFTPPFTSAPNVSDLFTYPPSATQFTSSSLIGNGGLVGLPLTFTTMALPNFNQSRTIVAFDAVTGKVTVGGAYPAIPINGESFVIDPSTSSFKSASLINAIGLIGSNLNFPPSLVQSQIVAFDATNGQVTFVARAVAPLVGANFFISPSNTSFASASLRTQVPPLSLTGQTLTMISGALTGRSTTITGYAGLINYGFVTFNAFTPAGTPATNDQFQIGNSTNSVTSAALSGVSTLVGRTINITTAGGTESRVIQAHNSGSGTVTVTPAFTTLPVPGDPFTITTVISDFITSLPIVFNQTATNAAGIGRKSLSLTISTPAVPLITSSATAIAVVATAFRYDITALNRPTSYTAAVTAPVTTLPAIGLGLLTASGSITDNPQKNTFASSALIGSNLPLSGNALTMLTGATTGQIRIVSAFDSASGTLTFNSPLNGLPALNDSFSIATGVIAGTPTVAGTFTISLGASNSNPASPGTRTLTLTINSRQAPIITSPNTANATQQFSFIYQIKATNDPTSFTVSGLPGGFNVISPIPALLGTVAVGNSTNQFTTSSLTGLSNPLGLEIVMTSGPALGNVRTIAAYDTATNPATVRIDTPFQTTLGASATPAAGNTFEIRGLIQGTPTVSGAFPVTLGAGNGVLPNASKILTLTIQGPVAPTIILPTDDTTRAPLMPTIYGNDGSTFPSFFISATGTQDIQFTVTNLPNGLTLDTATDTIQGVPIENGERIVTITPYNVATNPSAPPPSTAGGTNIVTAASRAKQLRIIISSTQPTIRDINATNIITGTVGVPLSLPLVVPPSVPIRIVGTTPINATVNNALLTQLGLTATVTSDNTGALVTLTGTPNAASVGQLIRITVSATNVATVNGPVTKDFFLSILPARPIITSPLTATGTDGVFFTYTITATGTPPISLTTSTLPDGLAISGATISGTPTSASIGSHNITLNASNAGGSQQDSKVLVISISPAGAAISSALTATGEEGKLFVYSMAASGTPPFTFSASPMPPGLSVQGANIIGTPTLAGIYNIVVTANNSVGGDSKLLVLTIRPSAPVITGSLTLQVLDGTPLTYTIQASGSQPMTFSAVGLPAGLSLSGNVISGTPAAAGEYNIQLNAVNSQGGDSKILVITVIPSLPVITSVPPYIVRATPGVPFTYRITATGSRPMTFDARNFPLGSNWKISGDTITGTPSTVSQTAVTLFATNALGQDQETLEIDVLFSPPTILRPPPDSVNISDGIFFQYQVEADGSPPMTFSATGLPPGVTISAATGLISGTPQVTGALFPQSFTATITARNNVPPNSDSKLLALIVSATAPRITGPLAASGIQGQALTPPIQIVATGTLPITFSAAPLPPGLTLNTSTGVISGTPTQTGATDVLITATNQAGTGLQTMTLTVTAVAPVITSPLLIAGIVGVPIASYTVTASNLPTSFTASNVPPGLTFNTTTGVLSGTPTTAGEYDVPIRAYNASPTFDEKTLHVSITSGSPIIVSTLSTTGRVGQPFSYQIDAVGLPTLVYAASPLPPGLSLSGNIISGTPTQENIYSVTLNVSNTIGSDTKILSIVIAAQPDDTDGDGFPDELEIALGTDPNNAASTPFGNGQKANAPISINVTSLQIKLNFTSRGALKDALAVRGSLPLGAGASVAGEEVTIVVGGMPRKFTLDGRGSGPKSGADRFTLSSAKLAEDAPFSLKMSNQNFKVPLAKIGLTNSNTFNQSRQVRVFVLYKNKLYESKKLSTYSSKLNKTGTAKATKVDFAQ